jgi:hypothetical protein
VVEGAKAELIPVKGSRALTRRGTPENFPQTARALSHFAGTEKAGPVAVAAAAAALPSAGGSDPRRPAVVHCTFFVVWGELSS